MFQVDVISDFHLSRLYMKTWVEICMTDAEEETVPIPLMLQCLLQTSEDYREG